VGAATLVFWVAAAVALAGGLGVILFKEPIKNVLSLVLVMMSLAILFLLLSAQFVFAVQVIVYAGAVMVLFLFVVALLGPIREGPSPRLRFLSWLAIPIVRVLVGGIWATLGADH